jgi:hypothetical protein
MTLIHTSMVSALNETTRRTATSDLASLKMVVPFPEEILPTFKVTQKDMFPSLVKPVTRALPMMVKYPYNRVLRLVLTS